MSMTTKGKLIALIEGMPEDDVQCLWEYMISTFGLNKSVSWDQIEEEIPDAMDLAMIKDIVADDDGELISHHEIKRYMSL